MYHRIINYDRYTTIHQPAMSQRRWTVWKLILCEIHKPDHTGDSGNEALFWQTTSGCISMCSCHKCGHECILQCENGLRMWSHTTHLSPFTLGLSAILRWMLITNLDGDGDIGSHTSCTPHLICTALLLSCCLSLPVSRCGIIFERLLSVRNAYWVREREFNNNCFTHYMITWPLIAQEVTSLDNGYFKW